MSENENIVDDEKFDGQETFKQWFQDNLRIIISIIIVVAIAGGIYSYSKRSAERNIHADKSIEQGIDKNSNSEGDTASSDSKSNAKAKSAVAAPVSQETTTSFIETAAKGEGSTALARKALASYLEKNSDSSLSVEHKVYIEDYLRKKVAKKSIGVGTSIEFSKDLLAEAIAKSKTLNNNQLQNLHKYALRAPSLK